MTTTLPALGTRVRLRRDVDRFPHFIAPAGATGTVVNSEPGLFAVALDDHLEGAETWDNEVVWQDQDEYVPRDVEEVTEPRTPSDFAALPPIGAKVRALYPNTRWGEGVVVSHVPNPKMKPLAVERTDGSVGYFHPDQIEEV